MQIKMITPDLIINDVLKTWPQTIPIFYKYRMGCVGCDMNSFETIHDSLKIYSIPVEQFLRDINEILDKAPIS